MLTTNVWNSLRGNTRKSVVKCSLFVSINPQKNLNDYSQAFFVGVEGYNMKEWVTVLRAAEEAERSIAVSLPMQ